MNSKWGRNGDDARDASMGSKVQGQQGAKRETDGEYKVAPGAQFVIRRGDTCIPVRPIRFFEVGDTGCVTGERGAENGVPLCRETFAQSSHFEGRASEPVNEQTAHAIPGE
jgi:hypothetical protein